MTEVPVYHLELPYDELGHILTDFGHDVGIIKLHQFIKIHSLELDAVGRNFTAHCEVHDHALN